MINELIGGLEPNWRAALSNFITSNDYQPAREALNALLQEDQDSYFPNGEVILKAFDKTEFNDVRVVIVGQDPYPRRADATGLAFSTDGCMTDSLESIYDAIARDDVEGVRPASGNLERWAGQGVLLLNRVLTFRKCNRCTANIHKHQGWEAFTEAVVNALLGREIPIHFMLWGNDAKNLKKYIKKHINRERHIIHESRHPTPRKAEYVREFLDCGHFSAAIEEIRGREGVNYEPIDWFLTPEEDRQQ
ncbi:MAG: uracil-DNA glycosylase [Candidatus Halichondribacter symbioticus]